MKQVRNLFLNIYLTVFCYLDFSNKSSFVASIFIEVPIYTVFSLNMD